MLGIMGNQNFRWATPLP